MNNLQSIESAIADALAELYGKHLEILKLDVAERTICAKLAAILQASFDLHAVHAEYNRHGVESKAIKIPDADGVLTLSLVSPDFIIHQPVMTGKISWSSKSRRLRTPVPTPLTWRSLD